VNLLWPSSSSRRGDGEGIGSHPGLSVALLVVWLTASISSYEIEALVGLVGLESQGHGCGPHPIVGGVVRPSRRAISRRWVTVPVVTA
jgi:hypothetical protein